MPFRARLYHSQKTRGCGRFHTKIALAQKMIQDSQAPDPLQTLSLGR